MTISIREVIEQCALKVAPSAEHRARPTDYIGGEETMDLLSALAGEIRALAAQYEGCIVAAGDAVTHAHDGDSLDVIPLYRAKDPKS